MARLQDGDLVPDLTLTTLTGRTIALRTATEPLWLCLRRYASCPFCSSQVHLIYDGLPRLTRAGIRPVVIFPSPRQRIERYAPGGGTKLDTVSDESFATHHAFGTEASMMGAMRTAAHVKKTLAAVARYPHNPLAYDGKYFGLPAEFFVYGGRIARAFYGRALDDGLSVDEACDWSRTVLGLPRSSPPAAPH